jgi:TolB-like protein/class 3 adenylate cyclase/cytochrome c-type biogenesis protein CcmH/NrfG
MATEDFKRKLTAILSADVEGYSRLMREDEEATVSTITTYRSAMATLIQQYRGRVVDSPGDNILAEFTSVVDAVNCAVEIQRELAERNAELPVERKMEFRIGVNLGDVIEEGERIYGDGVNIAARVEGLADGGGICISGTVYDAIEAKLGLEYEYLGEQAVKNIPKAMRVYRVLSFPGAAAHRVIEAKKAVGRTWRNVFLAIAAILVVGAAAIATWKFYLRPAPPIEVASVEKMAFPLPDKPSIAVLPFDNLSEDPKQEYFGDGLTDEIIAVLSKVPKLFVIARNSTFTYKGKPVKVQQVSEELGVRYVLEGSVKQAAEKIRITAQLIDALSGHHLWVQDEITKEIITAMQVKLTEGEQARAVAKGTNNLQAYLKYLQANEYYHRLNIESNNLARQLAGEAIALDPEYAMAYGVLAKTHLFDFWLDTSTSQEQSLAEATELLQKAIVLDDTYAEAYGLLGFVFSMRRQPDEALAQAEKAVALNPNAAESHFLLGMVITLCCKEEEAIPEYKKAIRLNPIPPNIYLWSLGLAYAETGQYDEAITWCEKAVRQQPDDLLARIMMTAAYSWSGRDEEARAEAAEVLRINPKFSLERFAKRAGTGLVSELRKAGLK